jgi:hypothetical protein
MRKFFLAALFNCCFFVSFGQNNYWQQQVNSNIDVTLNDSDHTLDGYIKMDYINNSPDTLNFIWIHLWPNAYKNDQTALSDQELQNGNTDFYFSDESKRGYINRLNFKVNGLLVLIENHPQHQDIIKIILPVPLLPKSTCKIETPFHVKLPFNFSRGGHNGQSYQVTQWYPKPAVYDRKGWHPMPYLNQGEFYSEFGNYKVQITLPANYIVAATGIVASENSPTPIIIRKVEDESFNKPARKKGFGIAKPIVDNTIPSAKNNRTIVYTQNDVHDFAWFADKNFVKIQDTLALSSGRIIKAVAYHLGGEEDKGYWKNAVKFLKKAILSRSTMLGEYPYDIVSVAEGDVAYAGGMEYPTITLISGVESEQDLEELTEHEVGHNWLYGILASNERENPWMDEGMNTYYGTRYWNGEKDINIRAEIGSKFLQNRMPDNLNIFAMQNMIALKSDQPIATAADKFSGTNYNISAYHKPNRWMKLLENKLGRPLFDSAMQQYFRQWKFKHPYPDDFKKIMEEVSVQNLDKEFDLLKVRGDLPAVKVDRKYKLQSFFSFKETDQFKYLFAAPAVGFNFYDKIMLGAIIHNYTLPAEKFQFLIAPLFGTGSKSLNGMARASYTWMPGDNGKQIVFSLAGASFNGDEFTDSTTKKNYLRFTKIVPSVKIIFANSNPQSQAIKYLQWKTFFIAEQGLQFTRDTINNVDNIAYPTSSRYINQLQFAVENSRKLYPYKVQLMLEQGESFARLAFTGNYYFNYAKGGGLDVRLFAGKFFYLGDKTFLKQAQTDAYHLNMTGPKGYEDYTYSGYYAGRNEFEGFSSQQIMQRDGFFKVRTDLLSSKIGKSDNWLAAANFVTDFPSAINPLQILPVKLPLKIFVDIGTYAEAWAKNANQGKLIYDAGLQLSLFKNTLNIYVPILYSKVYGDYFKSTITEKRFLKNISFSIDIQNISLKKIIPQLAF